MRQDARNEPREGDFPAGNIEQESNVEELTTRVVERSPTGTGDQLDYLLAGSIINVAPRRLLFILFYFILLFHQSANCYFCLLTVETIG